jgi:signal transduction histidine kinase
VDEAVDYTKANGKEKALEVFTDRNGEFVRGELYIFAYDFDGKVLAHGGNAALVGQNLIDMKDPNGVMVIQELRKIAEGDGGWLEYMWENPLTGKIEPKVGYVVRVDDNWWLGSGFYE